MTEQKKIPQHVAIIMDGNGRWAQERGRERSFGHANGVESVRNAIKGAIAGGVKYLTLYTFSTENWGRPKDEVDTLMELLCRCVVDETAELQRQGVRVKMTGSRERLSDKVLEHISRIENETDNGRVLTVILALNYSSRQEITDAVKRIARKVSEGGIRIDDISERTVAESLYTAPYPDPDLIIRTGGECRLSNFLMWQAAYSELYFTSTLWPDFDEKTFKEALDIYTSRHRRFGKVEQQD